MGNMTCRNIDTTSAHTCTSGSANGATLTYDAEGRMDSWTVPSGTTASDKFLYDNEGNRVLQRTSTTTGSTTTVTDDITFDGFTEVTISGGTTATSKYYSAKGQRVAMRVNGILSYLLSDMLGSSTVALNSDGSGQAVQLFSPYGSVRYSWGTMPTSYNFTGQRLDSQTGLLYYNSRYYDPVSERFVRADTVESNAGGRDPYAYVGGNPETKNDPTGNRQVGACDPNAGDCSGSGNPPAKQTSPGGNTGTGGSLPPTLVVRLLLYSVKFAGGLAFNNHLTLIQTAAETLNAIGLPVPVLNKAELGAQLSTFLGDDLSSYLNLNDNGTFFNFVTTGFGGGKNFNAFMRIAGKLIDIGAIAFFGVDLFGSGDILNKVEDGLNVASSALSLLRTQIASWTGVSEEVIADLAETLGLIAVVMQGAVMAKNILDSIASGGKDQKSDKGPPGGGPPLPPASAALVPVSQFQQSGESYPQGPQVLQNFQTSLGGFTPLMI